LDAALGDKAAVEDDGLASGGSHAEGVPIVLLLDAGGVHGDGDEADLVAGGAIVAVRGGDAEVESHDIGDGGHGDEDLGAADRPAAAVDGSGGGAGAKVVRPAFRSGGADDEVAGGYGAQALFQGLSLAPRPSAPFEPSISISAGGRRVQEGSVH